FNAWEWGRTIADRASLGLFSPAVSLGFGLVDSATPGLLTRVWQPLERALGGSADGPSFDPFTLMAAAVNSAPFHPPAKQLCLTRDDLLRSVLSDFVRSQLSTIIASRGLWRAVADWGDEKNLPDWVTS